MDFMELYAQKRMTAAQAAALVKSGDWVDYGWAVNTPVAVDAELAKRLPELEGVNFRGGILMWVPEIFQIDDPAAHICGTVVLVTVISDVRPGTGRTQKASPRWSVGSSPSGTASSDRVERQSTSSGTSAGASKAKRQCPGPVCCQPVRVTPRVSCSWVRASSLTACGQRRLSRMHSPRIRLTSKAESRK